MAPPRSSTLIPLFGLVLSTVVSKSARIYRTAVAVFTPDEREWLRAELVSAARSDPRVCGAAHTGSAAALRLDRWSDIDLALCLHPDASPEQVIADWTQRLYHDHEAVAHVDVMRGATLFRVFLLASTLQVDVAFWNAEHFGATGPNFQLVFGQARPPLPAADSNPGFLIGMAWLYALHVRSSLARGRIFQAEYMLSGMRNHVCELTCLRYGVNPNQGRGLDDLPAVERDTMAKCVPRSIEHSELRRAFQATMRSLLAELPNVDGALATALSGPLSEIVA